MRRLLGIALLVALPVAMPGTMGMAMAQAKPASLADIRAEVASLSTELENLRGELTSSGAALERAGGDTALRRMDAMEAALQRLTGRTEELGNRIDRVVADGTNRIGDLEFRITELEGGTPSATPTPPLGGTAAGGAPRPASGTLAVGEQADFDRAKAALDTGSFQGAADLFATFAATYTGGTLTGEAQYYRGEALAALGDTSGAAKAYLESFSGAPSGPKAPAALARLGASLGALGQTEDACLTLGEVGVRYPGAPEIADAEAERGELGCR